MDSGGAFSAYRSVLHQAFKAPIATITAAISIQFCKCEWTPNGVNSPTSHWPMWSPKDIKNYFPGTVLINSQNETVIFLPGIALNGSMASHRVFALGHPFSELDAGRDGYNYCWRSISAGSGMPAVMTGAQFAASLPSTQRVKPRPIRLQSREPPSLSNALAEVPQRVGGPGYFA